MPGGLSFGYTAAAKKTAKKPALQGSDDEEDPTSTAPGGAVKDAGRLQDEGSQAAVQGQWSLALRRWDAALATAGVDQQHVLHEMKAQVFLETGDCWRAVQSASAAVRLSPDWAEGHLTLSRAQLGFGEPELALQEMEAALALEPGLEREAAAEVGELRVLVLQPQRRSQAARLHVVHPS